MASTNYCKFIILGLYSGFYFTAVVFVQYVVRWIINKNISFIFYSRSIHILNHFSDL